MKQKNGYAAAVVFIEGTLMGSGERVVTASRRLGLEPILIASNLAPYEYQGTCTKCIECDTKNYAHVSDIVNQLTGYFHIKGIGTTSDFGLEVAQIEAKNRGLPAPDGVALAACRSKAETRRLLPEISPGNYVLNSPEDIDPIKHLLSFPLIVKPDSLNGATGVASCASIEECKNHVGNLFELLKHLGTQRPTVLLESIIPGREYSVECFDGVAIGVTQVQMKIDSFVEIGHLFPAPLRGEDESMLRGYAEQALLATGLTWGAAHVQFRLEDGQAGLIEINPRLGGGHVPSIVEHASGVRLEEAYVRKICRLPLGDCLEPTKHDFSAVHFRTVNEQAVLRRISLDRALKSEGCVYAGHRGGVNTTWSPRGSNHDRVACAIAISTEAAEAERRAYAAASVIDLEWER
ncbi:argininosuccinate lyase [Salinarimonas ramus]|uniref:Argininosuccinate lyase n=2 Tax=Salinarimonas ramus TaxID=690164 RepID=A0A917Q9R9_9HYPH|nr:argininosuccinate lyase [Salinarimonas ramus]